MDVLSTSDYLIGAAVIAIGLATVLAMLSDDRKLYLTAFAFKCVCFGGYIALLKLSLLGDSESYHYHGVEWEAMLRNFFTSGDPGYFTGGGFWSIDGDNTMRMQSLTGLCMFLTGGSFLGTSAIFSAFGFAGQVLLYKAFCLGRNSRIRDPFTVLGCLLLPTVSFWSTGILKESVGFLGLGLCAYGWRRFAYGVMGPKTSVCISFGLYILFLFRPQLFPCLVIAATASLFVAAPLRKMTDAQRIAAALSVVILIAGAVKLWTTGVGGREYLASLPEKFQRDAEGYLDLDAYHIVSSGSFTWGAIILGAPLAVANALLRPFPWDVRNFLMGLAAVENLIIYYVLWVIASNWTNMWRRSDNVVQKKDIIFSAVFSLLFAAIVGTSTLNLGSTSRYRTPVLPFIFSIAALVSPRPWRLGGLRGGGFLGQSPHAALPRVRRPGPKSNVSR